MAYTSYLKSLAAGSISAGLYLVIFGLGTGAPLMLLPSLPLFMLGLSHPPRDLILAIATGAGIALGVTGLASGLFYTSFIAIPVLLFAPAAITHRHGHLRPIGELLTDLAIYAALIYAALIAWYVPHGGLETVVAGYLKQSFADADPETQGMAESIGSTLAFLILAASAWWWVLLTYAHAVIANMLLGLKSRKMRASLALTRFNPPPWLLVILMFCAVVSLSGPPLAFPAQVILLITLFPYFLLGLALVQEKTKHWPAQMLALFLLYFLMLSLVWPALIIAAAGVWMQCRTLLHTAQKH